MMSGTTIESLGRVYSKISAVMPALTAGDQKSDVVGALLLIAILIEKQRPWSSHKIGHRAAFLELMGKLYDQTSASAATAADETSP
jgi:hypothetical protein